MKVKQLMDFLSKIPDDSEVRVGFAMSEYSTPILYLESGSIFSIDENQNEKHTKSVEIVISY